MVLDKETSPRRRSEDSFIFSHPVQHDTLVPISVRELGVPAGWSCWPFGQVGRSGRSVWSVWSVGLVGRSVGR